MQNILSYYETDNVTRFQLRFLHIQGINSRPKHYENFRSIDNRNFICYVTRFCMASIVYAKYFTNAVRDKGNSNCARNDFCLQVKPIYSFDNVNEQHVKT